MLLILLCAYVVAFYFVIITLYKAQLHKYHTFVKFLNSLGFILVVIYAGLTNNNMLWLQMMPGFVLCLAGDVLLGYAEIKNHAKTFMIGLVSFLTAHIVFIICLLLIHPIKWYDFVFPFIMVFIGWYLTTLKGMDMEGMRIPVVIYAFFVSMLFSKSVSIVIADGISTRNIQLCLGSFLFLFSDIILLFIRFYNKKLYLNKFFNLFAYYGGLLLLAMSTLY
ncbi:MAG: lysoplasmalogenase family protein [Lachnospiraceae bacterium]